MRLANAVRHHYTHVRILSGVIYALHSFLPTRCERHPVAHRGPKFNVKSPVCIVLVNKMSLGYREQGV